MSSHVVNLWGWGLDWTSDWGRSRGRTIWRIPDGRALDVWAGRGSWPPCLLGEWDADEESGERQGNKIPDKTTDGKQWGAPVEGWTREANSGCLQWKKFSSGNKDKREEDSWYICCRWDPRFRQDRMAPGWKETIEFLTGCSTISVLLEEFPGIGGMLPTQGNQHRGKGIPGQHRTRVWHEKSFDDTQFSHNSLFKPWHGLFCWAPRVQARAHLATPFLEGIFSLKLQPHPILGPGFSHLF